MTRISKEEYKILKDLDDKWEWIARDSRGGNGGSLAVYLQKPFKRYDVGGWDFDCSIGIRYIDNQLFQFIQWDDEEPWNIKELIEHYEYWLKLAKNPTIANLVGYEDESKETEVKKDKEDLIKYLKKEISNFKPGQMIYDYLTFILKQLNQLDEPEPKKIMLQDITDRLWELSLNNRKQWLERLNNEFQEGYIVPLGLKTTEGEEQYLTFNGSYFASQRKRGLQQTFATLEEIPEFYRDLAERVL